MGHINEIAQVIRATYIQEVERLAALRGQTASYTPPKRWDGGTDSEGKNHKPIWPLVARKVVALHIEPEDFVRSIFAGAKNRPYPNQLLSDEAVAAYRKGQKYTEATIEDAFESQMNAVTVEVAAQMEFGANEHRAWLTAVATDDLPLTALFRYCVLLRLRKEGCRDHRVLRLAHYFEEAAVLQYRLNRKLLERVWGEFIPQAFRTQAMESRKRRATGGNR